MFIDFQYSVSVFRLVRLKTIFFHFTLNVLYPREKIIGKQTNNESHRESNPIKSIFNSSCFIFEVSVRNPSHKGYKGHEKLFYRRPSVFCFIPVVQKGISFKNLFHNWKSLETVGSHIIPIKTGCHGLVAIQPVRNSKETK